ncbi:EutN/CcmL family microcompartment protein [soil metagenome]
MILAKIVGTVVATRKDERLVSSKLLVARPMDPRGKAEGVYLVAVDTVDAGVGETVLIVSGSSARMAAGLKDCPIDAAIVGIVDTVEVHDEAPAEAHARAGAPPQGRVTVPGD